MNATATLSAGCGLLAHATVRRTAAECDDLRRAPGPTVTGVEAVSPALLKQMDEQTLVALEAVAAVRSHPAMAGESWDEWGLVAAPRFFGRAVLVATVNRFKSEGAWGVSPHLIPHRSLHSLSGTVSQVYKIRGPNYGVGGGPGHIAEGLASALPLLDSLDLPGVLLVVTRTRPELPPTRAGKLHPDEVVEAVALALVPEDRPDSFRRVGMELTPEAADALSFDRLIGLLETDEPADPWSRTQRLLRLDRPHHRPPSPHVSRYAARSCPPAEARP